MGIRAGLRLGGYRFRRRLQHEPAQAANMPAALSARLPRATPRPGILARTWCYHFADALQDEEGDLTANSLAFVMGHPFLEPTDYVAAVRETASRCTAALRAGKPIARAAVAALTAATVTYGFGEAEQVAAVDEVLGEELRHRLDDVITAVLARPELAWWSERYQPSEYPWYRTSESDLDPQRRSASSPYPTISGALWWPSSQLILPAFESYRRIPAGLADVPCTYLAFGDDSDEADPASLRYGEAPGGQGRVYDVEGPEHWVDLVERYPARLIDSDVLRYGWQGDVPGQAYTVDWYSAARDYDGVHLAIGAALRSQYAPLPLDQERLGGPAWTMMTGWVPGQVLWLDAEREAAIAAKD
ncbi:MULTISPECIES: hypothetical protein [unclassified Actinobaculum]|uniref:hypothetical protein n=1 Tax=unclassified Actinobaculum TaxID=2609299 RepID=UPI000D527BC1|nr:MULTISPECIES: hypothetical protein [unclassified Actinobaculum]AWE42193.1 hypothetical protein DDD63_04860 [Actinobaculum sp. 313]RTE50756.1 hypothetical protein EKN07_01015 [Actinobaculum sp. 352]